MNGLHVYFSVVEHLKTYIDFLQSSFYEVSHAKAQLTTSFEKSRTLFPGTALLVVQPLFEMRSDRKGTIRSSLLCTWCSYMCCLYLVYYVPGAAILCTWCIQGQSSWASFAPVGVSARKSYWIWVGSGSWLLICGQRWYNSFERMVFLLYRPIQSWMVANHRSGHTVNILLPSRKIVTLPELPELLHMQLLGIDGMQHQPSRNRLHACSSPAKHIWMPAGSGL